MMDVEHLSSPSTLNRLCHVAALAREGKSAVALDELILALLASERAPLLQSVEDVAAAVGGVYGARIPEHRVQSSVDRLLNRGDLIRARDSRELLASPLIRAKMQELSEAALGLEVAVRDEWLGLIHRRISDFTTDYDEALWQCLNLY